MTKTRPLIAHVIYRLDIGGLENGLVNLVNRLPREKYAHAIICLDDFSDFHSRIDRDDIEVFAIRKKPGQDPLALWRLFKLFRQLKPDIVHSRNLAALDALLPAMLAGVPVRIHGEHGRDVDDLDGSNRKLQWLRRIHRPMIDRYVPLSMELERYLKERIGVPPKLITRIYNGVDTERFRPSVANGAVETQVQIPGFPGNSVIVAAVGRFQSVKGQAILADAFIELMNRAPDLRSTARLMLIGDGPQYDQVKQQLDAGGVAEYVWAPGSSNDVALFLQVADVFIQPSLAEGISNTLLEAMATGLPAIATRVGGNPELVVEGETGTLIPAGDSMALADQMERYIRDPILCAEQGRNARARVEREFTMDRMVGNYMTVYDQLLSS